MVGLWLSACRYEAGSGAPKKVLVAALPVG
jgi:hypothetical protein